MRFDVDAEAVAKKVSKLRAEHPDLYVELCKTVFNDLISLHEENNSICYINVEDSELVGRFVRVFDFGYNLTNEFLGFYFMTSTEDVLISGHLDSAKLLESIKLVNEPMSLAYIVDLLYNDIMHEASIRKDSTQ